MPSLPLNIFSSSECEQIKNMLKNPEEDLQEIIELLEENVEVEYKKFEESKENYRKIVETIPDLYFLVDENGTHLDFKGNENLLYLKPEMFLGKTLYETLPRNVAEKYEKAISKTLKTKLPTIIEYSLNVQGILKFYEARNLYFSSNRVALFVRDITDRKEVEKRLKESEEKFKSIAEQSLMGICIAQNNQIKYINKTYADIFGYSVEEMGNWEMSDGIKAIFPDDREFAIEQLTKKQKGDKDVVNHYQYRGIKKSGEIIWVDQYSKTIIFNEKTANFIMLIDITQSKNIEKKLYHERDLIYTLLDNHPDFIYFKDSKARFQHISKRFSDFFGRRVEEIIGKTDLELFPEDIAKKTHTEDLQIIKTGIPLINKEETNEKIWVLTTKMPWIDKEGKIKGLFGISRDITERKKTEQKLKESEEKFRTITEQSLMGVIIIQDRRVIYVNEAESSIMGYSIQEMMEWYQEDLFEHIHPDDRINAINRSQEGKEGQELPPYFAYRIVTKSGKAKNVEVYSKFIEFNEKPAILTYVLDVTEKKEAEQKYESLINNLSDIILELDMKGIVSYVSPQCYDILGYQPSEIIGKNVFLFIHSKDASIIAESMKKAISTKEIISILPYRLLHKDGDIINVSARGKFVIVGGNEKFIGAIRDITFQKKIEQELKFSEEKYRLLFDNSPVGIGISTIDGKVLDSNDAMVKLTGFSAEELNKIGAPSIYVDQSDRSEILKLLKASGKLHDYEVKLRRKDNTEFYGSVSFDLTELRGEQIIQTSLRDITKGKDAELEMIKLNNLKSELLRRTSHELKTPLVSIKGFSDILLDLHKEDLDDYVISTINQIRKGCIRLQNLINDILKTAELESGAIQAHKSEVDLSFLIKLCVNELKGLSELRKQTIKIEIHELMLIIIGEEEIHQVISNILSNAIKYTPPNGTIEIRSEIQDNSIIISVKDNGLGFTEEEKGRIFKQFGKIERYGQGLDIVSGGSGLGLYISKKIIELYGGKIWVESEGSKKGSTFYFSLPLIEKF